MRSTVKVLVVMVGLAVVGWAGVGRCGELLLRLGPEEIVEAGGADIVVPGYSVPSFVDWDNDGLPDLLIGQGSGSYAAKVRIYRNVGTASEPAFADFFYVQSNGADLTCPGAGCMGCFPRVVYWNADEKKDLLLGLADGTLRVYYNIGSDAEPTFGAAVTVVGGEASQPLDVGARATPDFVDWNNDGMMDLVVGAYDGLLHLYTNCGFGGALPPCFATSTINGFPPVRANGADLYVPSGRSSPVAMDLDGDGKKDLLAGNTAGQLLFYSNTGTDSEPNFAGYELVRSNGVAIDLPGSPRSRPSVCDWTDDGYLDVLIGASDGKVHLYQSIPQPGDMDRDYDVDLADFAVFAAYYGLGDCDDCGGADLNSDGAVDMADAAELAAWWLAGTDS